MALTVKTTGIEDYIGESQNIRMLVIGGPDAGKTRMSSFWPKPFFIDCEDGRGSLADRKVAYVEVNNSQGMLDALAHLKGFESTPKADRPYRTVVIDTLDSFQRKVKDEWLQNTKSQTFKGYDAWGYLDTKIGMLMTRLLNLDYNVIVLVHYKEKSGENDTRELVLQLQGDIKDTCFNDFALVGWIGTYWESENGERVEKRGLTFRKTPEKSFLKDRYGVMPRWVPITLTSEEDYTFVRSAFQARIEGLTPGEVIGEIPTADPDAQVGVIQPAGGPLPPQEARDVPLHQHDKTTVGKMCRDEGVTTCVDGTPIKANATKAELVQALEYARAIKEQPTLLDLPDTNLQPESDAAPESVAVEPQAEPPVEATPDVEPATIEAPVDVATGEIAPEQPVGDVVQAPVADVPSIPADADNIAVAPPSEPVVPAGDVCQETGCDVLLATQDSRYVQLSEWKYEQRLCGAHYVARRNQQIDAVAR